MKRGLTLAAATLAALVLAGVALAANTASISVTHTPMASSSSQATTIHVKIPQATDPIARIAIYVPNGYTANLSAAAGTTIGSVSASAFAHDTGLVLPLTGGVLTDSPSAHTSDAAACLGGAAAAVWNLNLSVAGQTVQVPLYVSATSGAETALGSYKLVICLPPPDVPVGTPGRAVFGVQVLDALFTVNGIFTTPAAPTTAAWLAFYTPYNPGAGTVNALGTFEAEALVGVPASVKAHAVAVKHTTYKVTGTVTEGTAPAAGVAVTLYRGSKRVAGATTGAGGTFSFSGKLAKGTNVFQVKASAPERSAACVAPAPPTLAPAGCTGATLASWKAASATLKVKK
jgi:hypothetical protein